jgi:hypothetical protein
MSSACDWPLALRSRGRSPGQRTALSKVDNQAPFVGCGRDETIDVLERYQRIMREKASLGRLKGRLL